MTTEESKEATASETAATPPSTAPMTPIEQIEAWQPTISKGIDAFREYISESAKGNFLIENRIISLSFFIVGIAGIVSIIAMCRNNADTAERIVIPLLSFAGGLGIGNRMTRKTGESK